MIGFRAVSESATSPVLDGPTAKPGARLISVQVAGSLYGLRVEEVQEVIGLRPLTRIFHAPPAMAGVTSLRGDVLPVIDLALLLGAEASRSEADARIVVVRETSGQKRRAGLRIDRLGGLRDVPDGGLTPTPATAAESVRALVLGVLSTPPPCSVLSVEAILNADALVPLAGAADVES